MAAALCFDLPGGGAQFCFHSMAGNYDTERLVEVPGELRRILRREKATPLWDAYCSTAMRAWRATQRSWLVVVERPPAYAPELKQVEGLWSSLKAIELANLVTASLGGVIVAQTHRGTDRSVARRTWPTRPFGMPARQSHGDNPAPRDQSNTLL
jgi:hypothetical protein